MAASLFYEIPNEVDKFLQRLIVLKGTELLSSHWARALKRGRSFRALPTCTPKIASSAGRADPGSRHNKLKRFDL